MIKGLALTKYSAIAASTRQRFLQFCPALHQAGIDIDIAPLLNDEYTRAMLAGKPVSRSGIIKDYWTRFSDIKRARAYDFIWLQYEAFPYLPDFVERLVNRSGLPVIADYDDALHAQYQNARNPISRGLLGSKISAIQSRAALVLCGNQNLLNYAKQHCSNTAFMPTCLDTEVFCPAPKPPTSNVTIGWIGAPSTWGFLKPILPVLEALIDSQNVRVKIIGAPNVAYSHSGIEFVPWSEATEVAALQSLDIGIMPLPDSPWTRGKSGYKLIQYMACGLPVVASPVGANKDIIEDGQNGLLATSDADWHHHLSTLIGDAKMRKRLGKNGRQKAIKYYSTQTHTPNLTRLITEVVTNSSRNPLS